MTKLSTILIIDDEKDLVKLLEKKIKENGHEVLVAFDGEEGIEKSKLNPDLILLDIMMPKIDGFEVCQKIRDNVVCPIIFLSARQSETDKIRGFNLGGDDYITKPFGLRELLAKIEANLRREIYEKVWGYDKDGDNTTVVEMIKKIRRKFSNVDDTEQYISTVWGIGYKWNKR